MFESRVQTPNQDTQQGAGYNFLLHLQYLGEPELKFQSPHKARDYYVHAMFPTLPWVSYLIITDSLQWCSEMGHTSILYGDNWGMERLHVPCHPVRK